jgi:NADH:ubiquinone oxidoreductase subunit 4 (subunit M)
MVLFPALVLMLVLGVFPQLLLKVTNPTVLQWVEGLKL